MPSLIIRLTYLLLALFLSLNLSYGQTTEFLGCQGSGNAEVDLDRNNWNGGSTANHSEGYMLNFDLPSQADPCTKITKLIVTVDIVSFSESLPSGCNMFAYFENLYLSSGSLSFSPASEDLIVGGQVNGGLDPNSFTRTFEVDCGTNTIPFDGQFGYDIIPAVAGGCNQMMVSNSDISIGYSVCVDAEIDVDPNAAVIADAGDDEDICDGETVPLTASGGDMYEWDTGDMTPTINVSPSSTTIYMVTVTDTDGCTDIDEVEVTVNTNDNAEAGDDDEICEGETGVLMASGGITFDWDNGAGSGATINVNPTSTTTYTVTVTDVNGCTGVDQADVIVNTNSNAEAGDDDEICEGGTGTLTASGGDSYVWDNGGGSGATINVNPTTTTTYTVTVTDGNGCTGTDQANVIVTPDPSADAGGDDEICLGETATISASGGDTYIWDSGQTTAVITVNPSTTTTYVVTVTDANGCSATDDHQVEVFVNNNAFAGADETICDGTSITLTASGGDDYDWDNGDNSASTTVSPSITTTYTVTVTDSNDCEDTDEVIVAVVACSCEIVDAFLFGPSCNDNGTPGDDTDDFLEFELEPDAVNASGGYSVSVSSGAISPTSGLYGGSTTFQLQNGSAGSGNIVVTIVDNDDSDCDYDLTINDPGSCSTMCSLTDAGFNALDCDNGGTGADSSDDFITFSLDPQVTNGGGTYTITSASTTVTPATGTYGSPTSFQLPPGSAGGGPVVVTITDAVNPSCSLDVTISDPGTCSDDCFIISAIFLDFTCNDNNTASDSSDDFVTFTLNSTAINSSTTYTVVASGGQTVMPTTGTYGTTVNFQLGPGSAGSGPITLTITDSADPTCTITGTTLDPGTCSSPTFDCPTLMLNIGDPCDDNDPLTMNDSVQADCSCAGSVSFDCPAIMLNIGDPCDDNDPLTMNDSVQADCSCAGSVSFDCPAIMQNIGDPCDDNDPMTVNDTIQSDCSCAGSVSFDCPVLMLNIGDPCDDFDPLTDNDTVQADCSCTGTKTFDCPVLMLNFGDACDDGDPLTLNDIVQFDCTCAGSINFDCPVLMLNIGDPCDDSDPLTDNDTVQADCSCAGTLTFDCPVLMLNIGDPCDDGNAMTDNDVVLADCSCAGTMIFDCPILMLNIGDPCDDGDPMTDNDIVQADCSCSGEITFDCPALMLNFGDSCDDGDPLTLNDIVQFDCTCAGSINFDCPVLMLNIGDPCDDGDIETDNDTVQADCTCVGISIFDCPAIALNIGDPCDDGDPTTDNDIVQPDCSCAGSLIFDCPTIMLNIGDPCDDGDPTTDNDIIQTDCSCAGSVSFDCPTQMVNIGDPCDDGDPMTSGDIIQADCSCAGSVSFDCPALMLNIGDPCDDGDPMTSNDIIQTDCSCAGIDECDITTLLPTPCEDPDPCTINDTEIVLPDGTICVPCLGEPVDCSMVDQLTTLVCNDNNDLTENDVKIVLTCDTTMICTPCMGFLPTVKVFLPNSLQFDGSNEDFGVYSSEPVLIDAFTIYDRWGEQVYFVSDMMSDDPSARWNGRLNDKKVEQGVYVYQIEFNPVYNLGNRVGSITIVR